LSENEEHPHEHSHEPHEHSHAHHEEQSHYYGKNEKRKGDKTKLAIAIVAIAVVLVAAFLLTRGGSQAPAASPTPTAPAGAKVDSDSLKIKVKNFLEANFLAEQGLTTEIANITEKNGVYDVYTKILKDGKVVEQTSVYVTLDGKKILLGGAMDLVDATPVPSPSPIAKLERPKLEFFVMSFCPYGKLAEQGVGPVARLLGAKADFEPHYIIYGPEFCSAYGMTPEQCCFANTTLCSLHGVNEANEDARQLCVLRDFKSGFWNYVDYVNANCSLDNIESCWKDAAKSAGVNATKVGECFAKDGAALLAAEKAFGDSKQVSASPTVFLNGVVFKSKLSPEEFKTGVCDSFKTTPTECGNTLSNETAAASGSCGS